MSDKNNISFIYPIENELGNVSYQFKVNERMAQIQVKGFERCDYYSIEYWFGDECDGSWEPFSLCSAPCCGCPGIVEIVWPVTNFFLEIPGKYRLVLANSDDKHIDDPNHFEDVEIIVKYIDKSFDPTNYI